MCKVDTVKMELNTVQKRKNCMNNKTTKAVGVVTLDDIPTINAVIAKGDRVEIGPGPNGTVKIVHIKRKFIKSGQGKDCPKC